MCNLYGGAHVTLESIAFATSGSSLIVIHTQRHRPRVCHNGFKKQNLVKDVIAGCTPQKHAVFMREQYAAQKWHESIKDVGLF